MTPSLSVLLGTHNPRLRVLEEALAARRSNKT